MHIVVVQMLTEGVAFRLVYKQKGLADEAFDAAVKQWGALDNLDATPTEGKLRMSDDFGHRLVADISEISAIFLADQQGEFEVQQHQGLDQARAQFEFAKAVESDPKLKLLRSMLPQGGRLA